MTTNSTARSTWTVDRDEVFFRIVQGVFPASYLAAATALLSSYDDDATDAPAPSAAGHRGSGAHQHALQLDAAAAHAGSPVS